MADVGFGNMTLDFSNKPLVGNKIKGSVGAGNLTIILPKERHTGSGEDSGFLVVQCESTFKS